VIRKVRDKQESEKWREKKEFGSVGQPCTAEPFCQGFLKVARASWGANPGSFDFVNFISTSLYP
jgi:hypothetical protein